MTQTLAILLDAYRNLNSKRLFWIVLAISGIVVVAFACVGINDQGLKIMFWQADDPFFNAKNFPPAIFYKFIFSFLGVGIWLAWITTTLALVSTASMFPDILTQGSIDVFISKPIGRLRLFITEYVAGLLFVALQVLVFTICSFLVLGLRGGVWVPALFWAVPIMVCFYSYLFSVCVLLGVWTRSAMASLLLTILFWACLCLLDRGEHVLLEFANAEKKGISVFTPPMPDEDGPETHDDKSNSAKSSKPGLFSMQTFHGLVYRMKMFVPKLSETLSLLDRQLVDATDISKDRPGLSGRRPRGGRGERMQAVESETGNEILHRPLSWVLGTSLGFEFVVLALAAWIFCRRDY